MPNADETLPKLRLVGPEEVAPAADVDDPVEDVVDDDLPPEAVDALIAAYLVEHGLPEDTEPDRF